MQISKTGANVSRKTYFILWIFKYRVSISLLFLCFFTLPNIFFFFKVWWRFVKHCLSYRSLGDSFKKLQCFTIYFSFFFKWKYNIVCMCIHTFSINSARYFFFSWFCYRSFIPGKTYLLQRFYLRHSSLAALYIQCCGRKPNTSKSNS